MPEFQTFKDLSVTFKKHPVTDDLVTVKNTAAISQSIVNLLLTGKGERLFQPNLGSGIYNTLFEPLDFGTAGIIRAEVIDVINRYEPRIIINNIIVVPDYDNNGYSVELTYIVRGREDRPVGIEFFLERTR
jgi:phage baseplate assembly protein W